MGSKVGVGLGVCVAVGEGVIVFVGVDVSAAVGVAVVTGEHAENRKTMRESNFKDFMLLL